MATKGCMCILMLISAVMGAGRLEKPSLSLIAELLRSPAQNVRNSPSYNYYNKAIRNLYAV